MKTLLHHLLETLYFPFSFPDHHELKSHHLNLKSCSRIYLLYEKFYTLHNSIAKATESPLKFI